MNKSEILKEVNEIFVDVLEADGLVLTESTAAGDVENWDSLSHIQLVVSIEKHFKIRFTSKEIQGWKNIGELVDSIESKLTTA